METSKLDQDPNLLPSLPEEVIIEILSGLPVKSLLKFRCVCKSWLSLISSSQFIKTHLKKSTEYSKNYANHTIILISSPSPPVSYYTCSFHSLLYHTSSINLIEMDLPKKGPNNSSWIFGSCNGLLCVALDPCTLILYNPSMKKFKKLPFSGTEAQSRPYISFGFGYHELNDDYKVAEMTGFTNDDVMYVIEVKIYSLRNDSWRKVENCPNGIVTGLFGASVCGKLHWLARGTDGASVILVVDMGMGEIDKMRMFEYEDGIVTWSLMDSGGSLCACGEYLLLRVDVWVMKEYGVEETWMKLVSVPYPVYPTGQLRPVFVSENGEILLNHEEGVMLYKRDGAFETRDIHGGDGGSLVVAAPPYIESLVQPCFD